MRQRAAVRRPPTFHRRKHSSLVVGTVALAAYCYAAELGVDASRKSLFVFSPECCGLSNSLAAFKDNRRCCVNESSRQRLCPSFRQRSRLFWLIGGGGGNTEDDASSSSSSPSSSSSSPSSSQRHNAESDTFSDPTRDEDDLLDETRTAAGRERRQEDRRRLERKTDVVIGRTSAIPGATDFPLDPEATTQQFLEQADSVETEIYLQTQQGLEMLKMFQLEQADAAFQRVYQLKPNAYLWQAGLVKFYLEDYVGAAQLFVKNAKISEGRFDAPASEERIWRDACELKLKSERDRKAKQGMRVDKTITIPPMGESFTDGTPPSEARKVMGIALELFGASVSKDGVNVAINKAKLRAICGDGQGGPDYKMWKLTSWYYLGLYYDATGDFEESKACMKMAIRHSTSSALASDLIHALPVLHMSRRDWYDDEEMSFHMAPPQESGAASDDSIPSYLPSSTSVSPSVAKSMWKSILEIQSSQMQAALRERSLRTSGSKRELQERLFYALLEDDAIVKP